MEASKEIFNGIDSALRDYVEREVLPCYAGVDAAHDEKHIRTVTSNALSLAKNLPVDRNMVYVIASYHDIGIRYGRADHEITSARWLRGDAYLLRFFDAEQIDVMAKAIEDHRASSGHAPRSIYGCIIAEADRDIDPIRVVRRSLQFALANHPGAAKEEIVSISAKHIAEKYGEGGYLKLYLNDPRNQKGLDTIRGWIKEGALESILLRELSNL